jgi:two-component system, cell cycle sensor histidine kinase and response regulator CckA
VILRDVTERRQTEEALRQSEERFRSIYQNAAIGIAQVAIEGTLRMVNPAFCKMLGQSSAELLGKKFSNITHPDDRGREKELLDAMLSGERDSYETEQRYLRHDGTPIWVNVTSSIVKDIGGHPLYRISIIQDRTETKRAELLQEQLQQAQKLEAIGQLAGGISHDFNTLLNVMLGYSELLGSELASDDPRRGRVQQIESAAQMGAVLTKQLLAFSRKQAAHPLVIDLNKTVASFEPMLRRLLREDIEIQLNLPDGEFPAKIDPGQLQQIILNLATNAHDAMPEGGRLGIELKTVELDDIYVQQHPSVTPGTYQLLAITDTGTGIDAETASHIFEPFFTTKEAGKGTGLGLSTVYGIVKQSGGDIWVYSEPGLGSTFKIYLPQSNAPVEVVQNVRHIPQKLGGNETILLVDDSASLRQLTRELLSREGYTVLEAGDGMQALELFHQYKGKIHLLMTDIVMPKLRGTELAALITQERPNLAVVFLSGYTEEAVSRLHGYARISILEKPYTADTLLQTVRQVLGDTSIAA